MATEGDLELEGLEEDIAAQLDGDLPEQREPERQERAPPEPEPAFDRRSGQDRARDEQGRFAKREDEPEPQQGKVQQDKQPAKPYRAPWYKDDQHGAPWDKLPEPLRKAIEAREQEVQRGMTESGQKLSAWRPLEQALAPISEQLKQANISPQTYLHSLHQWNVALRSGSVEDRADAISGVISQSLQGASQEQIASALDRIAARLDIDLVKVGRWLEAGNGPPPPDPREDELKQLKRQIEALQAAPREAEMNALGQRIYDFTQERDEKGALKHPHFDDVRHLMASLAKSSPEASLEDLYTQALWAHPTHRQSLLEAQRLAEVRRARAGAGSPRSGYSNGVDRSRKPAGSIEDTVASTYDEMMGSA